MACWRVMSAAAIVVLGARVLPGGVPSGSLRARVERAVELWREGAAPLLVFTGGVGEHPPSEARVMLGVAAALGVPESACLLEERSRSTWENARHTAALLHARGIDAAIIVSDPFHLFRARQHFRRQGIDATPVAAPLEGRALRWTERVYWTARELVALARRPHLLFARRPGGPR